MAENETKAGIPEPVEIPTAEQMNKTLSSILEKMDRSVKPPTLGTIDIQHHREPELQDSIEFGPAGNRAKIYFDATKPDEARTKINNVIMMMTYISQETAGFGGKKKD